MAVAASSRGSSSLGIFTLPSFRLLWLGECISLLGDQFYLIALPWLVLRLTGSALAIGTVLAVAAIPRALFMLLGGALSDRFSPRDVVLTSTLVRCALVSLLATLTLTGAITPWMLYGFALLFGLADAFFFPAQNAILPQLVPTQKLQIANMLMQGTAQISLFVGPLAAGGFIAALDRGGHRANLFGLGLAFAIDAASFAVAALSVWFIHVRRADNGFEEPSEPTSMLRSIRDGLLYAWRDSALRTLFLLIAAVNLLVNGPLAVGIPVLAHDRLPGGAAAFGTIMSAFGGGSLLGTLAAGTLPKPAPRWMGSSLLLVTSVLGIGLALLGTATSTPLAALIAGGMGMANGYVVILFMTWLQTRTPAAMLGRTMSLLMVAALGLNPLSNAVAGVASGFSVPAFFAGAGILMTVMVLLSALNPAVRSMQHPVVESDHA